MTPISEGEGGKKDGFIVEGMPPQGNSGSESVSESVSESYSFSRYHFDPDSDTDPDPDDFAVDGPFSERHQSRSISRVGFCMGSSLLFSSAASNLRSSSWDWIFISSELCLKIASRRAACSFKSEAAWSRSRAFRFGGGAVSSPP